MEKIKKLLLLTTIMLLCVASHAQQRIYNQTMLSVSSGIVTIENIGWNVCIGIEQVIKSTNSSISGELFYQNSKTKQEGVNRNIYLFIPTYNYHYLNSGRFSSNLRLGLPIGLDNLKTPNYITYEPKDNLSLGIHTALQFEYLIGKTANIYLEGYYQYFFLSSSIKNNPGIRLGLKFIL